MNKPPLIFIIAGEASGDLLGADLMASLKTLKDIKFAGIGGERMTEEGLNSLFPMEELSIMGIWGIIKDLPNLLNRITLTVNTIEALKPDVVISIDAPEFNLRVLKRLNKLSKRPRLIHYVAPTVWAWRPGRAQKISKIIDRLLCIYPFEPPYFERYGLKTTFVGHPIVKHMNKLDIKRDSNLLCVLPGSRRSEIEKLLPVFRETVEEVVKHCSDLKVVIPTLPMFEKLVKSKTSDWPIEVKIGIGEEKRIKAFQESSVALAKSGTVALQLSAAHLPFVIAYKVGKINEWLARILVQTPWACMVNIILAFHRFGPAFVLNRRAKKRVPDLWIPEFIQNNCTPEKISPALIKLLRDTDARTRQLNAMNEAISKLKAPDNVAAHAVLEEIG